MSTTKSNKARGRNLQKWVAERVAGIFGVSHGYEDEAMLKPRVMGQAGVDIIIDDRLDFPWAIECKAVERLDLMKAIEQAKQYETTDKSWMVVTKRKGLKPIVIMDWEAFEDMAKDLYGR